MSSHPTDKAQLEDTLWSEIKKTRYGMLGLADDARQLQPMTAFAEPETRTLWFFTQRFNDLAKCEKDEAVYIVQAKDQELQACIAGHLDAVRDAGRIDKYWNPMVAAWFPEGKDDPNLILLRFVATNAEVWVSDAGSVKMIWEIAKANATHTPPDVGQHHSVDLNGGGGG